MIELCALPLAIAVGLGLNAMAVWMPPQRQAQMAGQ